MKNSVSLFFVLLLVALGSVACKVKEEFHETPTITISYFYCNPVLDASGKVVSAEDTLAWRYDENSSSYILDTLAMKDSIRVVFAAGFLSHGNNLVSCLFDYDTAQLSVHLGLTSEILNAAVPPTDTAACRLYFPPGYNALGFPVTYRARTTGALPLTLTVHSDAGESYSPVSIRLVQPVK